jgi:hypothetical protein
MKYFVKVDGTRFVSFEGMSEEAITAMLTNQNLTYEFVSESIYEEAITTQAETINALTARLVALEAK